MPDLADTGHPATPGADPAATAGAALEAFRSERYDEAARRWAHAAAHAVDDDDRRRWQELADRAAANVIAEAHRVVPARTFFDRTRLLAPPPDPQLPDPPPPRDLRPWWDSLVQPAGKAVGDVFGKVFRFGSAVLARRASGPVWTAWDRKGLTAGTMVLAHMREELMAHNLHTTYPPGAKVGFVPDGLTPPPGVTHFRTADGSWNRLDDPKEGAAGTRFLRNVANASIRPAGHDDPALLTPNPRTISRKLLTRRLDADGPVVQEVPFLNLLAASWIQFQNHDWVTHGENLLAHDDPLLIPLDADDPVRELTGQEALVVPRTQADPTHPGPDGGETTPVTFVNEVTHWWDGSQLYGSDLETQRRLRSGVGGRLRLEPDGRLPVADDGVEDTGFVRNWWVGLSMWHTLFAREHNSICTMLAGRYPEWDDERLFQTARLVNAAVMAKIHSIEWTPAILPNPSLNLGLNANWYGMLTYKFRRPGKRRTVARFNVASPELGGLVGNHIERHGHAYGLAEEFVEVYRLHSLLPERLHLRRHVDGSSIEDLPMPATRQAGSPRVTGRVSLADLFFSFGTQHPGALVLHNYPHFMQQLSIPDHPVFDMGAVDILRARERGVPRYNEFRRQLGLKPIRRFEDLNPDPAVVRAIREVYGDNVESLDLMVGTLAEGHRPSGFGFGETMFQIFIINASRRLQADRFYTDDYRPEVYTPEGMQWVDDATLKRVILRHLPELERTGLGNVMNGFEPWDTDAQLDPVRHPLRACLPELRGDPWTGDAHR
ncbi:MAG: peroxidase [Actinobacteria bacterium]|nr:peroxidase [Actinomycetota bacterium]